MSRVLSRALVCAAFLIGAAPAVSATFSFDALAPTNGATPFSITDSGVTARFTSPSGAGAFISEDMPPFATLGSSALANDNFTREELDIGFSSNLVGIQLNFATNDSASPTAVTLTATLNGAKVGSVTATGLVAASRLPEGALSLSGLSFNGVQITDSDPANAGFAIGAVSAQVPEPSTFLVLSAGLVGLGALRRRA